ncbi:MAG: polysaccharide deacetylase family protein [Anaerolineales bacterium]|nr:polysaccharide deacetylase family protein [Anaerolineales bacterium]
MYSQHTTSKKSIRSSIIIKLASLAFDSGIFRTGRQFWSKSLTVLNYHRIDDPHQDSFDSFLPNVSAIPAEFSHQMDYLARWFNVISLHELINWLDGHQSLPAYAALITFDDGYLDNYTQAYPILKKYDFPAVIFLTSGHIETDTPFYWDMAAYCFHHTNHDHVLFPESKERSWTNKLERRNVNKAWVESMKNLADSEKQKWINTLPAKLGVSIPKNYFRNLMLSWHQVREMSNNRIEFGSHTINHPILSKIPVDQAYIEINESKVKIETELGQKVRGFAYPNGSKNDINSEIEQLVHQAGYRAAFTLQNGPTSIREVRHNPYAVRRIFISHTHTLPQFALLTNNINRIRN